MTSAPRPRLAAVSVLAVAACLPGCAPDGDAPAAAEVVGEAGEASALASKVRPPADRDDVAGGAGPTAAAAGRPDAAAESHAEAAGGKGRGAAGAGSTRRPGARVKAVSGVEALDEFRRIAEGLSNGSNPYVGHEQIRELSAELDATWMEAAEHQANLARHLLRVGEVDAAVENVESANELVERLLEAERPSEELGALARLVRRTRGATYLRLAEVENCIDRHNRDCCIFPLEDGGRHASDEPARRALGIYLALAEEEPWNLGARWLCNVLAMALGEHPEALPADLVIPDAAFDSEYDIGRFVDVAPAVGVDVFSLCGGSAVEDFDGDGLLDIAASDYDPLGPLAVFFNDGRGGFEDRSERAGVRDQLGGLNLVSADYDSDGDADLLVLRGAWFFAEGRIRNSLLRNAGDGTFEDVTAQAGIQEPSYPTQTAAFGDFDADGHLDLYIGNEALRGGKGDRTGLPSQLFLNDGDGAFSRSQAATNDRYCKGVAAGDYDNDGDLDLYVSNLGTGEHGANRLYRNDGDAAFTDVAAAAGVQDPRRSFATWFFDHDNDGWLDVFVAAYDASVADVAADHLGLPDSATRPGLYRNLGNGRFRDRAREAGLDRPFLPMGANFGDLDNDGWLDVYLATGNPQYETLMPNVALRNDRARRFQDVTRSGGLGHLQKGHGVSFGDLDHDGDQDIYHELGGSFPGDRFQNALFLNPGHGHRFLYVELVGTRSNRSGVGARIRVDVDGPDGPRSIHRAVGSVSSFGGGGRRQELGLGRAERIVALEVEWPTSGMRQRFADLPLDRLVRVTEGTEEPEILELEPLGPHLATEH